MAIVIVVVVVLSSLFQTYQEGKSSSVMRALRQLVAAQVWVYRNNELIQIEAVKLVKGDIVKVNMGEKVPADLRILNSTGLKVNNSALTGENCDVKLGIEANHPDLYEAKNVARSGCNFTDGNAIALVFETGDNTFFGQIAKSTTSIEHP